MKNQVPGQRIYTTGQVARICQTSPRIVSRWVDQKYLNAYRLPGSQDRRIPEASLIRFLRENGIPYPTTIDLGKRILVVGTSDEFLKSLRHVFSESDGFRLETAADAFGAGCKASEFYPHCVLVDLALGRLDAGAIAFHFKKFSTQPHIIAIARQESLDDLRRFGFDDMFYQDSHVGELLVKVTRLIQQLHPSPGIRRNRLEIAQ